MDGLIPQRVYAKQLRSQLPPTAFNPDPSKLILLLINVLILLLGWGIGAQLNHWPKQWLWLYVPFAVVMANSVIVMAFASHDLMHGSVIRNYKLAYKISLVSQAILWMPPTLWKIIHNQIHHNKTNTPEDPDRNYQYQQPDTIGKRVQNLLFPSSEVSLVWLILGMMIQWSVYAFRNVFLALVENSSRQNYAPATFTVSNRERWKIAQEFALMLGMHFGVLAWLSFDPLKLALAYFLPIVLGHAGMMFYIYTNHLVSPMTDVNDPLVNSVSLRVPKILDLIHINFSHHAEHHIFPGLNSDYYPMVRELLGQLYPNQIGFVISPKEAWRLLLSTPRHYLDAVTLTDWQGQKRVPCYLNVS